jgi:hypothetical protein
MIGFCYYMLFCLDHSFVHFVFSESILKLFEVFPLNPKNTDVLWLLGMAFTAQALLTPDDKDAKLFFDSAAAYFKRAFRQDPSNPSYRFSSELADVKVLYHLFSSNAFLLFKFNNTNH